MGDTEVTAGPESGQIACSMTSVLLKHVRSTLGDDAVWELIERSGVSYTPTFLSDIGNWIWHDEAVALFQAAAELTGDSRVGLRVGELMVRQHAGTPVATLFRSLGSPEAVFEQLALAVTKFSTVTECIPVEVGPGRAVVISRARDGFDRNEHMCDLSRGTMSQPPVLFGLPAAAVEETQCQARGDEHCLYSITWDAVGAADAADPQKLVTALEAQLTAMRDRLDSMYATAKDLIAIDDLDAALARITERAATAVRAPRYLLAVRPRPDEPMCFHHRGFSDDQAREAAESLLADGSHDPSWLVADVASATRSYGRLMAASPTGAFFPHERDLLWVYASYAATVLDTATALDDARRQDERSRALLELSQAIVAANTGDEVAQRLADAVPAVVDCDRVGVFLWSDAEEALCCHAITGVSGDHRAAVRALRIHASDSPYLETLLRDADPAPLFFDPDEPDHYLADLMRRFGSQRLIVVPIVAHGRLYGILTVSAADRPERLAPNNDLRDRLAGVVAQAATSLDNARLMETMAHQARHDNLTGLLGHRAFHESLEEILQGGAPIGGFTLASVDIDDFKRINDNFGHPIGDEALRLVAEALRSSVRDQDVVFRVGGEEFAVLLPGLAARDAVPLADRLRAAVSAIPFRVPLRVSIGLAAWPADAADRDGLLARADAALYSAKRSGKDRTILAAVA
jgi:diguanylate cyclase (GGDEF)-like protein